MKEGPYLLGLDIGGTGAKVGLFALDGSLIGTGYGEYQMISKVPGQAEHDAEVWWRAAVQAISKAIKGINSKEILSIGVGCTNGLIAVDSKGQPLRSAIMLWDQRTLPEVEEVRRILGADNVFAIAGNPVAPGAYSLPSILWLKNEDPDTFDAAHKLMVPGGYIVARLTGQFTMDYSRASTTLLFDIRKMEWHSSFREALGIPLEKMPRVLPSEAVAGEITTQAARLTGLAPGTPVIAGCMDTVGASIGSGVMSPGDCFIIMGTAARVASTLGEPQFDDRFMNCTHVVNDRWLSIGAINGVGSSLRWLRDNFGQTEQTMANLTKQDAYDFLTAQAEQAPPGSKGLVFLPYISGERTPIWDPFARGVFFGVTLGHNRNDFIRSVLEGAAFAIKHVVEILELDRGLDIKTIRIGGAAAESNVWNQIIANALGKKIVSLTQAHTEVLGVAILAGVSVGAYPDYLTAVNQVVVTGREFHPEPIGQAVYDRLFPIYKELYIDVKPYFERLAKLDLPEVWITGAKKE